MATNTKISWADATWPIVTGCAPASEGCYNCYAARLSSTRLRHLPEYTGVAVDGKFTGEVRILPERLDWVFPGGKIGGARKRIFVASMSDLFHPKVPDGFIAWVWYTMARNPQHTFIVLTKRHARMKAWVTRWADTKADQELDGPQLVYGPDAHRETFKSGRGQLFADMLEVMGPPPPGAAWPTYDWAEGPRWWPAYPHNVWLMVSVEDQYWADVRIPYLLSTPAAVRGVSAEPLLGPLDLRLFLHSEPITGHCVDIDGYYWHDSCVHCARLDWVVAGGESGSDRPTELDWIRSLQQQCANAGVAFHMKQTGDVLARRLGLKSRSGNNPAEWPEPFPQEYPA